MSKANGKVRPGWMGGTQETTEQEEAVDAAPSPDRPEAAEEEVYTESQPEENSAGAGQVGVQADPEPPEENTEPSTKPDPTERIEAPAREPAKRSAVAGGTDEHVQHNATSSHSTYPAAPSFGKKNSGQSPRLGTEAGEETTYPRKASTAPTGIKAAISSFVERISGARHFVPGGGEATASQQSPEEVERRLKRALRETTINGFCRLAIGSHKGGVGKSSMAYAVAGAISYGTNLRVCLVDCDPNVGATRYMVPRPVENSVLDLAEDADQLSRLADLRAYVSQNEQMGLDILLNPVEAAQISNVEDLADAYERVDSVLSQFYDLVVFDLGQGFRDPAIRRLLELSDELVLVSDSEKIPNAQLPDALNYVEGLGVDLTRTTLCINHGRCRSEESEDTTVLRDKHASRLRRITEVEYDPAFSQLLNDRSFHPSQLALETRLGVLTTAGSALEGLRRDATTRAYEKVISFGSANTNKEGGN